MKARATAAPGFTLQGGSGIHALFRRQLFGRASALLLLLRAILVHELQGRAAVLNRAGELDRRFQGCCNACGYSNCASELTNVCHKSRFSGVARARNRAVQGAYRCSSEFGVRVRRVLRMFGHQLRLIRVYCHRHV